MFRHVSCTSGGSTCLSSCSLVDGLYSLRDWLSDSSTVGIPGHYSDNLKQKREKENNQRIYTHGPPTDHECIRTAILFFILFYTSHQIKHPYF